MAGEVAAAIVFWVVVRDKQTKQLIRTHSFKTHEEAIHYDLSTDGQDELPIGAEVSIEILATGKAPK